MKDEELSGLCEVVRMELNRRAKHEAEEANAAGRNFSRTYFYSYQGLIKKYFGSQEDEESEYLIIPIPLLGEDK